MRCQMFFLQCRYKELCELIAKSCLNVYLCFIGFGTDEKAIINILAKRTSGQRQQIAMAFKTGFGRVSFLILIIV